MTKSRERYGIYLRKLRRAGRQDAAPGVAGNIGNRSAIEAYINDAEDLAAEVLDTEGVRFTRDSNGVVPQLQSADLTRKHVPQAIDVLMFCRLAREEMASVNGREALWRGIKLEQSLDSLSGKIGPEATATKAPDKQPARQGNKSALRARAYLLRRDEFPEESKKASKIKIAGDFGVGYKQIERDLRRTARSRS